MSKRMSMMITKTPVVLFLFLSLYATAQPELRPWGNITGIRVDGQMIKFETRLLVIRNGWKSWQLTGKEMQRPKYTREGASQIVNTELNPIAFTERVTDVNKGEADVTVSIRATERVETDGVFIAFSFLEKQYEGGTIVVDQQKGIPISADSSTLVQYFQKPVSTFRIASAAQEVLVTLNEPTTVVIWQHTDREGDWVHLLLPIFQGTIDKDASFEKKLHVKATGMLDKSPVAIQIDPTKPGRVFEGFGGNFRLQNPFTDHQVIDYALRNMRLAWGRVEMPWRFWQPDKNSDPMAGGKKGLSTGVQNAMEMAQRLDKLGIPVILSAWSAPDWAIVGEPRTDPQNGVWGNPLNTENMNAIIKSLGDYVVFLKDNYGVEISMFSFNESDLGINVRQTGKEHAQLIRNLGAHFKERGLKTKMLLGDNSDANSFDFIIPAMEDASTHPYIGAISFHSWRGWEKETLQKWADAATKMNLPLIVGEGSIDAQAWGYPQIFLEPTYALEEINLYVRLLNICQPASILQWQLTADYSPMAGGGIFGDNSPLRPTQRFWNLKQLASTPEEVKALPSASAKPDVSVAALGNAVTSTYVIHLVNNGTTRKAELSGLPASVKQLKLFVTDKDRGMHAGGDILVKNGKANFILESMTYVTLVSE